MDVRLEQGLRELHAAETGPGVRLEDAPLRVSLVYPSPYHVAMSSLGYLQIHRLANARPGTRCERAMVPDAAQRAIHERTRTPLLTVETRRPAGDADVIALSLAYELELAGVVHALNMCGTEPLARDRGGRDPLVVLGGPITFSNPLPAGPFADVVLLGEAEATLERLLDLLEERPEAARGDGRARRAVLEQLASEPGFYVPALHGERLPAIAQAPDDRLPAVSHLFTPNTELASMQLIEPERGCHRGCTFCVMRRSTNGGMRLVAPDRVATLVDPHVEKVGLVGAAVTDHPRIKDILRDLIDVQGKRVGVSSLRADRLDDEMVGLLARGGYRSMTVALDAASERLRDEIEKNLKIRHVERATQLAKAHGMRHLKVYVVVALPGETEEDLDELVELLVSLSRTLPVVAALSPFVPKFHTPLARAPFAGEAAAARAIRHVKRGVKGRVKVRGPGGREAYVEYRLAQGGHQHAEAAIAAAEQGATLGVWKRALAGLPERVTVTDDLVPQATLRRRWHLKNAGLARTA